MTIKAIAHITGGAFYDKIARILPQNTAAVIRKDSWKPPLIFSLIQKKGGITDKEMYHTLNMGIGMVLVVPERAADQVSHFLRRGKTKCFTIGRIESGNGTVKVV